MSFVFIYITVTSQAEAEKISDVLVEERLVACANILPGMKSVYQWEGKIERAEETVLLLKTRSDLFSTVERRVKELHSYKTPCIVALPVVAGSVDYLGWIEQVTSKK